MTTISLRKQNTRLPPEVNRVLYVRNLPFNITSEEMYDILWQSGTAGETHHGLDVDVKDAVKKVSLEYLRCFCRVVFKSVCSSSGCEENLRLSSWCLLFVEIGFKGFESRSFWFEASDSCSASDSSSEIVSS
uniref:RRM domain-containing protein n=1 Tax=Brassica campestris TaxID=3711 RepID=M4CPK5_BRACM